MQARISDYVSGCSNALHGVILQKIVPKSEFADYVFICGLRFACAETCVAGSSGAVVAAAFWEGESVTL
jgi:hypothetical protein